MEFDDMEEFDFPETSRVRWHCRRGMLELDILLCAFLDNFYPSLSLEQKKTFVRLLELPDQTLYTLLIGSQKADDPALASMVERIRTSSQKR